LKTLEDHAGYVRSLSFDGKGLLASGSDDKMIKIWDVSSGLCVKKLSGHSGCVLSVIFDGNGLLESGSDDKSIKIWEIPLKNP
jgi:WD40 repeat protein